MKARADMFDALIHWDLFGTAVWGMAAVASIAAALWLQSCKARFGIARNSVIVALFLVGCWALTGSIAGMESNVTYAIEALRDLAWIYVLFQMFAADGRVEVIRPVRPLLAVLAFIEIMQAAMLGYMASAAGGQAVSSLGFQTLIMLNLLEVIGGLMLLHNLYGGASVEVREVVRWPATALTLLWGFDLNYFAIAYLTHDYPILLEVVRGGLALPIAAMLAFGATGTGENLKLRPSRAATFQSMSLILIGGYLLIMVSIAQWLSFTEGEFTQLLQFVFLVLATTLTSALLLSGRLRGFIRVTLVKHLFQHRYDYRTEWLRFTGTIGQSEQNQSSFEERVIRALADIVESPAGLLLTQTEAGHLALAGRWQWPTVEVPAEALDMTALRVLESANYVADLDAIRTGKSNQRYDHALPSWLLDEARAWAVVPLLHYERMIGAVVLVHPAHVRLLDWEDFDLLRVAGQQLASYLAEYAGQAALAEASRFDDFNRRIAFVMHDIKNLASQMSLLARNAESHAENPAFRADMLVTLRNSADKLNALLARLSRYGSAASNTVAPVDADAIARSVVAQLGKHHSVQMVAAQSVTVNANHASLEQALLHLVQNAVDASSANAPVFVRVGQSELNGEIEVLDSGTGMSPEFVRTRLFKPFDSTKSGGFGIGAYETRELVRAMGGTLEVESREGFGTRFVIRLPLSYTAEIIESLARQGNDQSRAV